MTSRSYSIPRSDRVGALFGLSTREVAYIGTVLMITILLFFAGRLWAGVVVGVAAIAVGFASWGGVRLHTRLMRRIKFWTTRPAMRRPGEVAAQIPPALAGLSIATVDGADLWPGHMCGAVRARSNMSMIVTVEGPQLATLGDAVDDQLDQWAAVLAGLCGQTGTGIARLSWTDVHRAADPAEATRYHDAHGAEGPFSDDYRAHLGSIATSMSRHTVLVTVTVSGATTRKVRTLTGEKRKIEQVVLTETAKVCRELTAKGFTVGAPLNGFQIADTIRHLGDPWRISPRRTARERLGVPLDGEVLPASFKPDLRTLTVDGAIHRTFEVVWPPQPVAGDWMWKVLAAGGGPKFTTVVFEPVSPLSTGRRLRRDIATIGSDAEVEARRKGRVNARRRGQLASLEQAESDLAAGHAELKVFGVIVVTDQSLEGLDHRCQAVIEAAAAQSSTRLQPLDSRHDLGFAAALPVGIRVGEPGR